MERVKKRCNPYRNRLNDPVKGFRSKTFPASLTGVLWGWFYEPLKCYEYCNLTLFDESYFIFYVISYPFY